MKVQKGPKAVAPVHAQVNVTDVVLGAMAQNTATNPSAVFPAMPPNCVNVHPVAVSAAALGVVLDASRHMTTMASFAFAAEAVKVGEVVLVVPADWTKTFA